MKIVKLVILFFTVGFSILSSLANADDNSLEKALFFVVRMDAQSDALFELSKSIGKDTEQYKLMVKSVGEEKADQFLFVGFLEEQLPYREQWERNLAQSYLDAFSVYELDSLLQEAKKSPYYSKWLEQRKLIGNNAQERSKEIFNTVALKSAERALEKINTSH